MKFPCLPSRWLASAAGFLALLTVNSWAAAPPPTVDVSAQGNSGVSTTATTISWSHTVGAGNNRLMVVGVSFNSTGGQTISSVTYGATTLTFLAGATSSLVASVTDSVWYAVLGNSASPSTATVTVTFSAAANAAGGSTTFFGVNQSSPIAANATATGNGAAAAVTVASASNQLVVDSLGALSGSAVFTDTLGGGQTSLWSDAGNVVVFADSSDAAGAASVTMNHTFTISALPAPSLWALVGLSLNPVPTIVNSGTAADVIFNLPAGSNAILEDDGTPGNGFSQLREASGGFTTLVFANPTGSLTLNRGSAADTLTINAVPDFTASLTVGSVGNEFSTVTVAGAMTLAANKNFSVNAASTVSFSTSSSDVILSGTGAASITTAKNISFASGSSVTTVNGNLTLSANQQVTPTSGDFIGINMFASTAQVTGTGTLSLSGKGGDAAVSDYGVFLQSGALVQGGTTSTATVSGTGGASSAGFDFGVIVVNSTVTSSGANVQVTGTGGGSGSAGGNQGVRVANAGQVTAGGSGTVTVLATGGAATGANNFGIYVVAASSTITSSGGAVQVTGIEGGSSSSYAIFSDSLGTFTTAANGGTLTLIGNSMSFDNSVTISAQSGSSVTLRPYTAGNAINLGGSDVIGTTLGLSAAELNRVTAGTINIGNASSGAITVSAAITHLNGNAIVLQSGVSPINLNASITTSGGALTVQNSVNLGANVVVDTTNGGGTPAGANITFNNPINADLAANNRTFTLAAGAGGTILLQNVGATRNVQTFTISSGASASLQQVQTRSGGISVTSAAITLNSDLNTAALATAGPVTLAGSIILGAPTITITTASTTPGNISFGTLADNGSGNIRTLNLTAGTGTVTFAASPGALNLEVDGTVAGTSHDRINVTGTVNLNNTVLVTPNSTIPFAPGQTLRLIDNLGAGAVVGTFSGLAEGATVAINGFNFTISYIGGTGNDVTLTQPAIPITVPLNPNNFPSAGAFTPSGNVTVITDGPVPTMTSGTTVINGVLYNPGGGATNIAVFTFGSFTFGAGLTMTATGSNCLAILSQGTMSIGGTIKVNGSGTTAGPGGGAGAIAVGNGKGPGGGTGNFNGGDGGGFGGLGGVTPGNATSGAIYGDLSLALAGGSGGGRSSYPPNGSVGGGGGGALELGAVGTLTLSAGSSLQALGAPGAAGASQDAGGGGSGGGILIDSLIGVTASGTIDASGGVGGTSVSGVFYGGGGGGAGRILIQRLVTPSSGTMLAAGAAGGTGTLANGTAGAAGSSLFTVAPTFTAATGGNPISADTFPATYTSLTGPIYQEGVAGDVSLGTIILNCPAGFTFDTGGTAPTVLITGSGTAANNINGATTGSSLATTRTVGQITFTVTQASLVPNTLTWQNIRVRPLQGRPLVSGRITKTGTSTMFAITGGLPSVATATSFGFLNEVNGVPAALTLRVQPPAAAVVGVPFAQSAVVVVKDQFGNFISTDAGRSIKAVRNAGLGTLQGPTTVSTVGGLATFNNLIHDTASLITVNFVDLSGSPLPTVTSDPVIVMDPGDNRGTDFWLAFPGNVNPASARLTLTVASDVPTTGTVSVPGLSFVANFSLGAGGSTNIPLPAAASINSSDVVETKGVRVVATQKVRVFAFNKVNTSSDGFVALPVSRIGQDYIALGYNNGGAVRGSQFTLVATVNGTAVTITPASTTGSRTVGVPYVVNLNAGQTYQLRNTVNSSAADLSRSTISANQPIALLGGHLAASVPATFGYGDHIVQQLLPTQAWGRNHLTTPFSTRSGYTVRVIAGANTTAVQTNGVALATLNLGEMREFILTNAATITADKPIQVAQYMHGSRYDRVNNGDPAMVIVPASEQFTFDYTLPAQAGFTSYFNLTVPATALDSVRLAGVLVAPTNFTALGASGYSYARLPVTAGTRRVTAAQPFGVMAYGFAYGEAYGYPGGMDVGAIASITSVAVTPTGVSRAFGAQHLVTATVLNGVTPVPGARVDFVVAGVNNRSGFNFTDASGQASFAYNGTNSVAGSDTITATSGGAVSGLATVNWGPATAPLIAGPAPVVVEATGSVGASVLLAATITDADGQALTAKWYVDGILVFTDLASAGFPGVTTLNTSLSALYGLSSHTVTIVAQDASDTSTFATTVTVVDTTAPVLTLNGVNPLTQIINTTFTDPGATASDVYAGNLTASIIVTGAVDTSRVGSYRRRYSVTDQSGNSSSVTRTVVVVDPTAPVVAAKPDCHGTNFWIALPGNIAVTPELSLLITSEFSTFGTVTIPALGFTNDFSVVAGVLTTVILPAGAAMDSSDLVEDKGVHVNSADDVTVCGFNRVSTSADGFLALPDDALGSNYRILGYHNGGPVPGSQFTLVASEAGTTTVTITPSTTTGARAAAVPYNVLLTQGQTYQLRNDTNSVAADLSGTLIAADKRVGVYGGHRAENTPNGIGSAGFAVEQLFPVEAQGKKYLLQPLGGRTGYTLRVQALANATAVSTNGVLFTNLVNSGDVAELVLTNAVLVTADQPVQVTQHAHGSNYELAANGDPFMMLISPYEQWLADYTFTTPASIYTNYVNITVTNAGSASVRLDGVLVSPTNFNAIGASGFSGASIPIARGAHTLAGVYPLGVGVYGHASQEAYGYLACSGAGLVGNVTSVALSPLGASTTIGVGRAFVATVRDLLNNPVVGVRVDFAITGLTTSNFFRFTDTNGQAGFSYVYTNNAAPGVDTIRASIGTVLTSTTHTWSYNGAPTILITGYTAPVPAGPVPAIIEAASPGGTSVTLQAAYGDPNGSPLVGNWYVDGSLVQSFILAGGGPPTSGVNLYTSTYSLGLHTVAAVVTDSITTVTNTTTVTIQDTTPPTLVLVGANPFPVSLGGPFVDPGATATDLVAGTLTGSITVSGTVNVNQSGSYLLTYTVTDPSGNMASTTRTVRVGTGPSTSCKTDSSGQVYALAFPGNIDVTPELSLLIVSPVNTFGTVTVPGLGFATNFTVTAGQITTVLIPVAASVDSSDLVEAKGVFVSAADDVTVYGVNRVTTSTDSYLALPQGTLGTSYTVLGYRNGGVIRGSQFTIVAGAAGSTTVTITPTTTTGAHVAGTPYNVILTQGQTYQLRNLTNSTAADLSGTVITATQPIAVFSGHRAANIPYSLSSADYIVEQLPPNPTWGKNFVTSPLATRTGDTFRFQASASGAGVFTNGVLYTNLTANQFGELILTNATHVTASNPILVAQYANGWRFDGVPNADPLMTLVPCYEQWLGDYQIANLANGYANYVNLVVTNAAVGALSLDGLNIPAGDYVAVGTSGFSYAAVPVSAGAHHLSGPVPFGVTVYGFANAEAYGHPGGMNLAAVANVTSIVLAQTVAFTSIGSSATHTVTATVNGSLAGVRVDFRISGHNSLIGFAFTDCTGVATFTYTNIGGTGVDSLEASVGTVTATTSTTAPVSFGTIDSLTTNVVDRFVVGTNFNGLTYAPEDHGYGATQFYSIRRDTNGTSYFDTITAGTGATTDRFNASTRTFDALTYAAPDLGYGALLFYYLSHDNAGVSTFGTISPGGVTGVTTDRFVVGTNFDALTFTAIDIGYGANLFYYVRHDVTGLSTFGTITPGGIVTDRFTVGYNVDALVFTDLIVPGGYGPNNFYYLRHDTNGVSTFGTIFLSGGPPPTTATVTDRFTVGSNATGLTFTATDAGGFGPNLFYFLRRGAVGSLTHAWVP